MPKKEKGWTEIADADMDTLPAQVALGEKNAETDKLGQAGGNGGPGGTQTQAEDKDGVQGNVKDAVCGDSHHGKGGQALEPQQVIHDKGTHHERRGQENVAGIFHCKGLDGFRGSQKHDNLVNVEQAENAQAGTQDKAGEECNGDSPFPVLVASGTQTPGFPRSQTAFFSTAPMPGPARAIPAPTGVGMSAIPGGIIFIWRRLPGLWGNGSRIGIKERNHYYN